MGNAHSSRRCILFSDHVFDELIKGRSQSAINLFHNKNVKISYLSVEPDRSELHLWCKALETLLNVLVISAYG